MVNSRGEYSASCQSKRQVYLLFDVIIIMSVSLEHRLLSIIKDPSFLSLGFFSYNVTHCMFRSYLAPPFFITQWELGLRGSSQILIFWLLLQLFIESSVSDSGVLCLVPASTHETMKANLLACKQEKISDHSQHLRLVFFLI